MLKSKFDLIILQKRI